PWRAGIQLGPQHRAYPLKPNRDEDLGGRLRSDSIQVLKPRATAAEIVAVEREHQGSIEADGQRRKRRVDLLELGEQLFERVSMSQQLLAEDRDPLPAVGRPSLFQPAEFWAAISVELVALPHPCRAQNLLPSQEVLRG